MQHLTPVSYWKSGYGRPQHCNALKSQFRQHCSKHNVLTTLLEHQTSRNAPESVLVAYHNGEYFPQHQTDFHYCGYENPSDTHYRVFEYARGLFLPHKRDVLTRPKPEYALVRLDAIFVAVFHYYLAFQNSDDQDGQRHTAPIRLEYPVLLQLQHYHPYNATYPRQWLCLKVMPRHSTSMRQFWHHAE